MKKFIINPLLLILLITIAACTTSTDTLKEVNSTNKQLINQLWQAEDILSLVIPDKVNITLLMNNDNKVSGSAGCNNYSGKLFQEKNKLSFSQMIVTMKACIPVIANIEHKYLQVLNQSKYYIIDEQGMLLLHDKNKKYLAKFSPKTADYQALTGSNPVITQGNDKHIDITLERVINLKTTMLTQYNCNKNTHITVSFTQRTHNKNTKNIAIINGYGKQVITLPTKQVGSGFLYSNGMYSLRGKGEQATWTVGKMIPMQCSAINPTEKQNNLH